MDKISNWLLVWAPHAISAETRTLKRALKPLLCVPNYRFLLLKAIRFTIYISIYLHQYKLKQRSRVLSLEQNYNRLKFDFDHFVNILQNYKQKQGVRLLQQSI